MQSNLRLPVNACQAALQPVALQPDDSQRRTIQPWVYRSAVGDHLGVVIFAATIGSRRQARRRALLLDVDLESVVCRQDR